MAHFEKYIILSVGLLFSCIQSEVPSLEYRLDDTELAVTGLWVYEKIKVSNNDYEIADQNTNPVDGKISFRQELPRRRIRYNADFNYQIEWIDRGDYELGTYDTPNWQPSFGTWMIKGDSLIHNPGTLFENSYFLRVSSDGRRLSRISQRFMSNSTSRWNYGDSKEFTEDFVKIEN